MAVLVGLNTRPERIKQVAQESLKRLKTEAVDLFYRHRVDPDILIEDVVGAVKELISKQFLPFSSRIRNTSIGCYTLRCFSFQ